MTNVEKISEIEELGNVTGGFMFSTMAFSHGHKTKKKTQKTVLETAAPQLRAPTHYPDVDNQPQDPLEALADGDNIL